jgi:hypothetical protein
MRNAARPLSLVSATLFLASCDRPAIDPSQSLVGAKQLPSAKILSREIIQINRGMDTVSPGPLTYELRPDDGLTITWYARDWKTVRAVENHHLSSDVAAQVRTALWRLRPEILEGIEQEIRPADCPPPPTDTSPEATVVFLPESPKPSVAHLVLGIVDIPYESTCNTRQGIEARKLVQRVLQSFPPSKIATEFEQSPKQFIPLP